jgi:hypothetical protein
VFITVLGAGDNIGRWVYLGGFIYGMALAVLLMMTRLVNARGCDLLSVLLGRFAWGIIGSPGGGRSSAE